MDLNQCFKSFSIVLTGVAELNGIQVAKFRNLLFNKYPSTMSSLMAEVEQILNTGKDLEKEILQRLILNKEYKELIRAIITLWYMGTIDKTVQSDDYYNALIWKVIHAHPLGLTGGYYGYWKYKPEN